MFCSKLIKTFILKLLVIFPNRFFAQFWPIVCDTTLFSLLVPIIHLVVPKATAAAVGIEPFETLLKAAERQTFFHD